MLGLLTDWKVPFDGFSIQCLVKAYLDKKKCDTVSCFKENMPGNYRPFLDVIFIYLKASIDLSLHLPWCFIVFTIIIHFQCQNIWEGLFSFLVIFLSCDLFNGEFPCDFLLIIRQTCSTLWYFYNHYFFAFKCIPTSCKIWKKLIVIPISLFFHNIGPNSSQILPQKPHPTHFAFFGFPKWNMLGYSIKY